MEKGMSDLKHVIYGNQWILWVEMMSNIHVLLYIANKSFPELLWHDTLYISLA